MISSCEYSGYHQWLKQVMQEEANIKIKLPESSHANIQIWTKQSFCRTRTKICIHYFDTGIPE